MSNNEPIWETHPSDLPEQCERWDIIERERRSAILHSPAGGWWGFVRGLAIGSWVNKWDALDAVIKRLRPLDPDPTAWNPHVAAEQGKGK